MKTIELVIDENVISSGGDAIAFVEMPAIEETFMAFSQQKQPEITDEYILEQLLMLEFGDSRVDLVHETDESLNDMTNAKFAQELREKQRIIGPVMTPSKLIPRIDDDGNEYEVYFSAETIEKISHKYMKDNNLHNVNIEHNPDNMVDDAYMVESWIVEDPSKDKSTLYGFSPVKGQWYTIYQLGDKTWNEFVKTGSVKGLSLEGWFYEQLKRK
jgi:hypothetical protein